ncbi:Beta-galactosidase [Frondihabitans sp. 762G35]|uniref:glycoside hydrolase family 35 protein n=1 Tax=Frondihabitans sp. 762G35 TaxID=1446794 RepID=UPI000D20526E|nr:beta-galactosidase family protein [Frondihabitans sp. 762G35]ARC57937.1 Beta-galactosidase [Frondihabitans sp. 762G35]
MTSRFTVGDDDFLLDGRPHRVLSGALHYFRVHPDHWADRIEKAKQLGLNTIETYVPWNDHEPVQGTWVDAGILDLARFLDLVAEAGLHAIVRPGPYICAEYDNGGLPAWLFSDPTTGIRRSEPRFLDAVGSYLRRVYEIVVPRQIDRGGPVVLVQIENEYGAYSDDRAYLEALVALTLDAGVTVPLTTVDQPEDRMLENGSLPGLLRTGSFGSRSRERLATLRQHQRTGPLMCSEYWNGWFDHWGDEHHTTPAAEQARDLDELLALGASVNLYMLHGGTNFGFTNGANDKGVYEPTVTSYDYDAPLDEAGNPTEKFFAFREVFAKYADVPPLTLERSEQPVPTPELRVAGAASLLPALDRLGSWQTSPEGDPPLFDDLGHYRGYLVLRADLGAAFAGGELAAAEVRDRASVFLDGVRVGTLERMNGDRALALPAGRDLVILLEDMGRVNYDRRIGERKGLVGPVTIDGDAVAWSALPLEVEGLLALVGSGAAVPAAATGADAVAEPSGPAVVRFAFDLAEPADLFLDTEGCGKGVAFVNGFPLGRYWRVGPQQTLYVPGPATLAGVNELVLFEVEDGHPAPVFSPAARLGPVALDALARQGA